MNFLDWAHFFNRKGRKGAAKVAEFFPLRLPRSEAYRGSLRKNLVFLVASFFYLFKIY